jgi:CPA2 family monovalent cation:H+ antiporter-2
VLFFVSVGMLFNPMSLIETPLPILATLFIIVIGKSVAAFLIVIAFRYPVSTALTSRPAWRRSASSPSSWPARRGAECCREQGRDLILAGAILSILLKLRADGAQLVVIEDADKIVAKLKADGIEIIAANAANADALAAANPAAARQLIVAIPNAFEAGRIVEAAKAANPGIDIIARAHSDAEVEHLTSLGADTVIMGEREIARGIVDKVRASRTPPEDRPPTG